MNWILFTPESFASYEDWETVCEEVGCDPRNTRYIKIHFDANEAEYEEDHE